MKIYNNINFRNFNTLKINNTIRQMYEVENAEEIYVLIYIFKELKVDFHVIGNGSKILFKDQLVKKPVILISKLFSEIYYRDNDILVSSGAQLKKLIVDAANKNMGGLESLFPIPASVGGAITMNAGDKNVTISKYVKGVYCIDKECKLHFFDNEKCGFNYRNSIFKNGKYIILYVMLNYETIEKNIILDNIKNAIQYRVNCQDVNKNTCGSLFKNPDNTFAYKLIIESKANKLKVNDAKLSDKHANFLINQNMASPKDILLLILLIKNKVYTKYKILLKEELIII